MKNVEQQELCNVMEVFQEKKDGESFQNLLTGLFKCPLLFPVGKGENKGQFLIAQQNDKRLFSAFTDMEEAQKAKTSMGDVDFASYTIEEYANIMVGADVQGLVVNLGCSNCCIINKDFLAGVVAPAFKENRIMPGLKSSVTGEYIQINKVPFSIGRSPQADLTIDDKTINEFHSLIIEREHKYYVVDRDSLNGVYVNGNKVEKEQEIVFDDVIEFCDAEFSFVPLGLADRQQIQNTVYGDDRAMIANSMFLMQNSLLVKEFMENTENFLDEMNNGDMTENYHKYFLIALETTCDMKEKELKIDNPKVIEDQRKVMLAKGVTIFEKNDYGFNKLEQEDGLVYTVDFPKALYIPGLSRRMYLVMKESGEKAVYLSRIMPDKVYLVKVDKDNNEINCGEAPATPDEELQKVLELGV